MSPRELDEDDVRVRPGKGSRPRTRRRPDFADAVPAMVVAVDRGRWTCRLGADGSGVELTATRGGGLRRTPVVVGDRVRVEGDTSGRTEALVRIVSLDERRSLLARTADDNEGTEKPVVANADQLAVVVSLTTPPPQPRLVDRCLVAAYAGGLVPLLLLTKADQPGADDTELRGVYAPLGVPVVTVARGRPLDDVVGALAGRTTVLFGSSGVGKSTLVNRLTASEQSTGGLSGVGKGRHTTSAAQALALPGGGWVVDTPGVRSFGLGGVTARTVIAAFPDLAEAAEHCPPGCDHRSPGCYLDEAGADPARLASLRRLLAGIA
ncbi:MAG TPA: ribosome small subunit-dependent GTPase A [Mycobacteriales bacterium]